MRTALSVALKDLRSDSRGKEIVPAMFALAAVLLLVFSFVLPVGALRAPAPAVKPGAIGVHLAASVFLWISILFAASLGFARSAMNEREEGRIEILAVSPADPAALFFGKAAANFVFIGVVEVALVALFGVFGGLDWGRLLPGFIWVAALANVGLATTGTLLMTASTYSRGREVLGPLLMFPIVFPLLLGCIRLTTSLFEAGTFGSDVRWFILMAAYDLVVLAIGSVTFEFVINE